MFISVKGLLSKSLPHVPELLDSPLSVERVWDARMHMTNVDLKILPR